MARTKYHYYEYGDKTNRLLSWQIKKEESDRYIHSIQLNDGNYIKDPREINTLFKNFYEELYKMDHNCGNIEAKIFLNKLQLPKIDDDDN